MKKILISIIVLIVIFSATYFIQQKLLNKDTTATTTGEAISSTAETIPKFNRPEVDDGTSLPKNNNINYNNNIPKAGNTEFNVDYKISAVQKPNVSGCVGKTYTPKITPNGGNVVGPFSYPVKFTFTGSVDDNLKINGRIVDAGKGVQSGSPCSHRHDLTYTADFPANTPIRIELVDQHGGEVAIRGKISIVKKDTKPVDEFVNVNVDIFVEKYWFSRTATPMYPITLYLNDGKKLTLLKNTNTHEGNADGKVTTSVKVKKGSANWISVAFDNTKYRVTSNNCGAAGAQSSPFNCNISNTQSDRTVNMRINRIK